MRLTKLMGALLACMAAVACAVPARAAEEVVSVFAAASTTRALTEIADAFKAKGLGEVKPTFSNAAALAKQIEQGAPAAIFISADERWMDYAAERGLIDLSTRVNLLSNRLALLAPLSFTTPVRIEPGFPLAKLLGEGGRLAVGNPDYVPMGIYAKGALQKLGVWQEVKDRLITTATVMETVAFVERGEAPLGIGFSSDVAGASRIKVAALFPEDSHDPVAYPVAMVKGRETPKSRAFYDFLRSDEAAGIFTRWGFRVLR